MGASPAVLCSQGLLLALSQHESWWANGRQ